MKHSCLHRCGFTLIEILVVITIIGVLVSLGIPTLANALRSAKQAGCMSNLRNVALATQLFATENEMLLVPSFLRDQRKATDKTEHWNSALLEFYNQVSNEVYLREDFSCTNWRDVGENYTNWNWGYGKNDSPLVVDGRNEGQGLYRVTIDTSGVANKNYIKTLNIKKPSNRIHYACCNQWHFNLNNFAENIDFDRHGEGRCNAAFFDGHIESLTRAEIERAILLPEN